MSVHAGPPPGRRIGPVPTRSRLASGTYVTLLGLADLAARALPMRMLVRLLGLVVITVDGDPDDPPADITVARGVGRRIVQAGARLPWRPGCVGSAITAVVLLRRRGVRCTLHLGVARERDAGLRAHAWVTVADQTIVGGTRTRYATVASYRRAQPTISTRP